MRSFKELMSLNGRTVAITGGAGYIGRAMADAVAELGASVAVIDVNEERLESVAYAVQKQYGISVSANVVDLADNSTLKELPRKITNELGSLDVLVNCAAFVGTSNLDGWAVPFEEQSVDTWRQAIEVNLTSAFALTQAAAPFLKTSGHGSIINVASIYGVYGPDLRLYEGTEMNNPAAYAASKGGVIQFTRWCSTVLAPHIRANVITPGGVIRDQDARFVERYVEKTPLKRMATEEDFKGAVCFLASDLSSYVTGQNLIIDGGFGVW